MNDICNCLSLFKIHLASRRINNKRKFQLRIFKQGSQEAVRYTKSLALTGTIPTIQLYVSVDTFNFHIIVNDNTATCF